jgi:hypothetical protein
LIISFAIRFVVGACVPFMVQHCLYYRSWNGDG